MFKHFIASKMMHKTKQKSKLKRIEIGPSTVSTEGSSTAGVFSGYFQAEEGQTFNDLISNGTAVTLYAHPEGSEEIDEVTGWFGVDYTVSSDPNLYYEGLSIHVVAGGGSLPFSIYSDSARTQEVGDSDVVNADTIYYLNIDPSKIKAQEEQY